MRCDSRPRCGARVAAALCGAVLAAGAAAQTPAVLEAERHPLSPSHVPTLPLQPPPPTPTVSWLQRFAGDENFRTAGAMTPAVPDPAAEPATASGVVRAVRAAQRKVKIEHGPIDALDMPGMTMLFGVADPALLDGLAPGQEIRFALESTDSGFVITRWLDGPTATASSAPTPGSPSAPASAPTPGSPSAPASAPGAGADARGVITSVRAGQRKLKVQHGPIVRLGMPAMTMVFSVAEPVAIENLAEGQQIDFDVDDSAGGYVITAVRPVAGR